MNKISCGAVKCNRNREGGNVMSKRCPSYVGFTCVNGSCPNAMADEYPEYGYEHCSCDECRYYKGCDDCALYGTKYCEEM